MTRLSAEDVAFALHRLRDETSSLRGRQAVDNLDTHITALEADRDAAHAQVVILQNTVESREESLCRAYEKHDTLEADLATARADAAALREVLERWDKFAVYAAGQMGDCRPLEMSLWYAVLFGEAKKAGSAALADVREEEERPDE